MSSDVGITISELESHLGEMLERVQHGERIPISQDGQVVAHLVPADAMASLEADRVFQRMEQRRRRLGKTPVTELLETSHEGHREP